MNRHSYMSGKEEMEAAWELRPQTDVTPQSRSHSKRFISKKETCKKNVRPDNGR